MPVVALVAGAPSASASVACDVTIDGVGVKYPTDKSVEFDFTVTNNSGAPQTVTIDSISGPANTVWSGVPTSFQAPVGTSVQSIEVTRTNNANGDAVITYTVCGQTLTTTAYVSI